MAKLNLSRKKRDNDLIKGYWNGGDLKSPNHKSSQHAKDKVKEFEEFLKRQAILGDRFLGYDIARKKHLSAIWILEKISVMKFTRSVIVLEKCPFWFQKQILFACCRMPNFIRGCIDAQGIGANLAEDAKYEFGEYRIEEIAMLSGVKEEMAIHTKLEIQEGHHMIPSDKEIREDLHSVKKYTTTTKHDRFDAKATDLGHGDRFWGLALADRAASGNTGEVRVPKTRKRKRKSNMTAGF